MEGGIAGMGRPLLPPLRSSAVVPHTKESTRPEGVNPAVWEMLWSIKHDTARAISLGESLDHRLLILEDSHDNVGTEISILKRTVADIVKSNQVLCGRLFRAEKTIERQRTEITDLRMRSMRDNVIIRSKGSDYKAMRGENTSSIFKRFLDKELHVPNSEHITISSSHRMGQAVGDANKMIIARLPFAEDRKRIFDNVKSLKGTGMSVINQIPSEVDERRQFAWSDFKNARDAKMPAKFVGGQLIVSGEAVSKYNPLQLPCNSLMLSDGVGPVKGAFSDIVSERDHAFLACSTKVKSLQAVRDGLDSLLLSDDFSKADHIPYAFRFHDADGKICENFSSDDDHGAGLQLLRALQSSNMIDVAVYAAHFTSDSPLTTKKRNESLKHIVSGAILALNNSWSNLSCQYWSRWWLGGK